jgi:hypothetical protein
MQFSDLYGLHKDRLYWKDLKVQKETIWQTMHKCKNNIKTNRSGTTYMETNRVDLAWYQV